VLDKNIAKKMFDEMPTLKAFQKILGFRKTTRGALIQEGYDIKAHFQIMVKFSW
jgi:hypothetical protein